MAVTGNPECRAFPGKRFQNHRVTRLLHRSLGQVSRNSVISLLVVYLLLYDVGFLLYLDLIWFGLFVCLFVCLFSQRYESSALISVVYPRSLTESGSSPARRKTKRKAPPPPTEFQARVIRSASVTIAVHAIEKELQVISALQSKVEFLN